MFLTNLGVVLRQTSFLGIGPEDFRPKSARSQMAEISNTGGANPLTGANIAPGGKSAQTYVL